MAEPINPAHAAPLSEETPLFIAPSQPPQASIEPGVSDQNFVASLPPPQELQPQLQQLAPQPPPASPATAPSLQTQPQTPLPSTSLPVRAPPGAPGRNFLNSHLAPYLRTGMTNVLDLRPQYPLRYLGEYLIAQSFIYEGATDENSITERFLFEEHGKLIRKMRPEALGGNIESGGKQKEGTEASEGMLNGSAEAPKTHGEDTEMEGS